MQVVFHSSSGDVRGVERFRGGYVCRFCGNGDDFGVYHSYSMERNIVYCRACLQFGKITEETLLEVVPLEISKDLFKQHEILLPKLTKLQYSCFNSLTEVIRLGATDIDVIAVTGAGKTEIIFYKLAEHVTKGEIVAYVCPRRDVIIELTNRIKNYFPNHVVVTYHNDFVRTKFGHIYILTMHQLIRFQDFFDLIVIDESDAFPYVGSAESSALERFVVRSCKLEAIRIYLTATPKILHEKQVFLATRFNMRPLAIPEFSRVLNLLKKFQYQSKVKQLNVLKENSWLVFVPTIKIGECVLEYFQMNFEDREVDLVYSTSTCRQESIDKFRGGTTDVLITTAILERGVTFIGVSVMILFPEHELFTKEMLIQMCGRVDRGSDVLPYRLLLLYDTYTENIKVVTKRIKELNKKRDAQLSNM